MNGETNERDVFPEANGSEDHLGVLLLDGSFASQLSRHVSSKVDGDPLWSARFLAEDPKAVVKTSLDFLRAGAEVVSTNTYQASVDGFVKHLGISEEVALQYIVEAVSHVKEAISLYQKEIEAEEATLSSNEKGTGEMRSVKLAHGNRYPLIAGSVGPYGASLHDGSEYRGEYVETVSMEEMTEWHRPRIAALVGAGVDFLAFETIPAVEEARVLLQLLTKEFPHQKAWLSFSSQDGERTSHGDDIVTAVQECCSLGGVQLVAIGANCLSPNLATSLLTRMSSSANLSVPLIVYPNSGELWDPEKGWQERKLPDPINAHVRKWLDLGARYVGGCCRVYAEDLRVIKEEIEAWQQEQRDK